MTDVFEDGAERSDPSADKRNAEGPIVDDSNSQNTDIETSTIGTSARAGAGVETPDFENPQLPREALPDYRELDFESVADSFRGYTVITTLIYWVPALLGATAINLIPKVTLLPGLLTPGAVALVTLLIGVYRWADAGQRGWAVREHDLSAREGIYWRSVTTLPYARIQHVETTSGPIERWRGLARLKLFTAGGMTADLTLIGLEAEAADTLREHLAEQIRLRDAREGESEAGHDADDAAGAGAPDDSISSAAEAPTAPVPGDDDEFTRSSEIDRTP